MNTKQRLATLEAENRALRTENAKLRRLVRRDVYCNDADAMPYSEVEEQERRRALREERQRLFGPWQPKGERVETVDEKRQQNVRC